MDSFIQPWTVVSGSFPRYFARFLPTSPLSFHHHLQFLFFLFLLISSGDDLLLYFQLAISQLDGYICETAHFRLDPKYRSLARAVIVVLVTSTATKCRGLMVPIRSNI